MVKNHSNRNKDLTTLLIGLLLLILLNFIASFAFERFDLTTEKRYSLAKASKDLARNLDDIVYVKVYLEGDFPASYKKLRDETQEMLDEFRAYANDNLDYEFINPAESGDEKITNEIYQQLFKQGLRPTDLSEKTTDGYSNKLIWPGAIFFYKGKEIPVQLLKSTIGGSAETMVNNSIEGLEYEIANAIYNLTTEEKPKIAFIEGHGELSKHEVASISTSLAEFYTIDRLALNEELHSLTERTIIDTTKSFAVKPKYNAIVIAKPTERFSEKDKFIIDQYIMYGGKVIWLIDPVFASMDSLQNSDVTMAIPLDLNLDDQLFTYGVRINTNLIQDLQSAPVPVVTGNIGNQPKTELFPWYFFPLLTPANSHPIVNNLNMVKGEFTSTIDTINKKDIHKTGLLKSSQYTKISSAPTRISLSILRYEPDQKQFNKGHQIAAVLLEGTFESVFKNRVPPQISASNEIAFKEKSVLNSMVVIADGDIAKNAVNKKTNEFMALGIDRYTKQQYGNADFLLNVVNYLCDENGLMSVRAKKFKIRMMDQTVLKAERFKWQLINTVLPVGLIIIFGFAHYLDRKKKYTK
ncbi:MAG: gliding motility-associated ABC transporter substrate-binding protein GldG [Flavobacteriales bacterium CG18_big_fil_WC_8_21_14_2_50_32_9]|nr:gliding motility-associated ABC transporter substrate-binding protein GldG [Flavobacteriales bacterium]NCT16232.1 gliding motility-associated ABC transporter substrate-binding protein GldG [Flavobacteriales bacterium]PIQ15558.1 MAG: gliding motility-associated ABC transporter substrate-binding protein GldG [Flavobacteriales bacterium CG18_big_fil_WC_8_21_14_2_50_32_9]PJC63061.1 MAG: gliding motility-associated ABC transporter substrate-binding protein GldG [Flavobacteriales bacterium CG_4_9_1